MPRWRRIAPPPRRRRVRRAAYGAPRASAVEQHSEQPRLERRPPLEAFNTANDGQPRVLTHFLGDGATAHRRLERGGADGAGSAGQPRRTWNAQKRAWYPLDEPDVVLHADRGYDSAARGYVEKRCVTCRGVEQRPWLVRCCGAVVDVTLDERMDEVAADRRNLSSSGSSERLISQSAYQDAQSASVAVGDPVDQVVGLRGLVERRHPVFDRGACHDGVRHSVGLGEGLRGRAVELEGDRRLITARTSGVK